MERIVILILLATVIGLGVFSASQMNLVESYESQTPEPTKPPPADITTRCGKPVQVMLTTSWTSIRGRNGCWMSYYRQPVDGVAETQINKDSSTVKQWVKGACAPDYKVPTNILEIRLKNGTPFQVTFLFTDHEPEDRC